MNRCHTCKRRRCVRATCRACLRTLRVKRRQRIAAGVCVYSAACGRPAELGKRCCAAHAAWFATYEKSRRVTGYVYQGWGQ